jgi:hypothetical protein
LDRGFFARIERLHAERRRRNALLHSQFLFEFLKIGQPPSSNRVRGENQIEFTQQNLDRAFPNGAVADGFRYEFYQSAPLHDFGASNQ